MTGVGPGKPLKIDWLKGGGVVRVNDLVITAGDDQSLFPGCIPVGKVGSVTPRVGSSLVDVSIEPVADLDRLSFVTVLLYDPSTRVTPSDTTIPTNG